MSVEYRSWVEVSRQRIAANFRAIRDVVGPKVEIAGVVKSDAYGHGAVEVSHILAAQGARWLAVSTVEEGVELRQAGIETRLLVIADSLPFTRAALAEYDLTPVLHSFEDLHGLNCFAGSKGVRLRYHLKLDTGMGRLGVLARATEIASAVRAAGNLALEGLMSHLASAGDYTTGQTERQICAFDGLCQALEGLGIVPKLRHLASTHPIAYGRREAFFDMVRPGLGLYGHTSPASGRAPAKILEVKPALAWKAAVLSTKEIPEGTPVGYGATFRAPRSMRIAVLGAGYADGVFHQLSNRGRVIAAGKLTPIIGAVSMDLTTIDVTACPSIQAGDEVTLLGSEGSASIDAQDIASLAGTISYDILCGIRARVKRIYVP
jgi:alanine racemase